MRHHRQDSSAKRTIGWLEPDPMMMSRSLGIADAMVMVSISAACLTLAGMLGLAFT